MRYSKEEIRKTQKGRGFWLHISNEIATQIIYRVQNFNISPNIFTLISLIFGILFGIAVVNGFLIISAIFLNLLYLFDNFDGQWARVKKMTSKFGALFDSLVDGWNISIVIFSIGVYLYDDTSNSLYLYLITIFFVLSFLDFALEKNMVVESDSNENESTSISLQERSSTLRPIIKIVDTVTLYDKWIFVITIGLLFNYIELSLMYVIGVRFVNYGVKLLKIYIIYK